jgi:tellurite methyltransferase
LRQDQERWDEQYRRTGPPLEKKPNAFLRRNIGLLKTGRALDLAAGEGSNAIFLTRQGFTVEAVDISKVALQRARKLARSMRLKVQFHYADLDTYSLGRERYDLITDFYFLDRRLIPKIKKALNPGGYVVFETYTTDHPKLGLGGPHRPDHLLRPNELIRLFSDLRILLYREGIFRIDGRRKAIASLIAARDQK